MSGLDRLSSFTVLCTFQLASISLNSLGGFTVCSILVNMLSATAKALLLPLLSSVAFAHPGSYGGFGYGGQKGYGHGSGKAIYLQTNEADNSLVAIPINPKDGTLSGGHKVSTGGSGSNIAVKGGSTPTTPDGLGSQGSVTTAGNVRLLPPSILPPNSLTDCSSYLL